jgi:hypothetical protein
MDVRGHSSAGRAPALQAGGHRFDPDWLHQHYLPDLLNYQFDCVRLVRMPLFKNPEVLF